MRISSSIILHLHHHRTQPPVSTTRKHHRAGRFPQSSNNLKDTCGQTLMPSAFDCLAVILHLSALGTVSSHASRFFIQSKSMSPCNTKTYHEMRIVEFQSYSARIATVARILWIAPGSNLGLDACHQTSNLNSSDRHIHAAKTPSLPGQAGQEGVGTLQWKTQLRARLSCMR